MNTWIATLGLAVACVAGSAPAEPASDARFAAATLDVSGHGETRLAPDMATIVLGVSGRANDAVGAMAQASAGMTRVLAALRAGGIDARNIRTSGVSLSPQYVYAEGQPPRLTGYQADNQVTVTVDDLARLGSAVDEVVSAGATNVGQISFGLKNPAAAQSLASLAAIKAMEDKAEAYATAAGYRIHRLVNLSEADAGSAVAPPRPMLMAARAEAAPVEPGEISVTADVTGEFELTR